LLECRGEEDSDNDGEGDSSCDIREFRHRVIDECNEDLQSCNDCGEDGEGTLISSNKVHNLKVNTMQENANQILLLSNDDEEQSYFPTQSF